MKKFCIAALAGVALASAARAADMPVKAPQSPAPIFSWTGFYAGGAVGGVWANDKISDQDGLNGFNNYKLKSSGVIGSGILGYNVQAGQFVYGIEADLGGMGIGKTIAEPNLGGVSTNRLNGGFYGDVTARLGWAFDRTLLYVKGGWAFLDADASVANIGVFPGGTATSEASDKFIGGWAIGGGLECAFAAGWSGKIEYMHFDFGNETANLVTPLSGNFRYPNKLTAEAVTAGLVYHFGH